MMDQVDVLNRLQSKVMSNPVYAREFAADPAKALGEAASELRPAYEKDRWIYRGVVLSLGIVLVVAAIGSIVLVWNGKTAPEVLVALGSASVGALAGLLAPSPIVKSG